MKKYTAVRDELNKVSPSFCLAKWQQVTIHLQNGQTHSCHHPMTHNVPLKELQNNPSALHNTNYKKQQRKKMLEGIRPEECNYCWKIEDAHPDNISDRSIKSSEEWAYPFLDDIKNKAWDLDVKPQYLEISFGNECNFKCAYCAPHISSAIMTEYQQFGHYSTMPGYSIESLKRAGLFPIQKDEHNPYIEAFWNWWPDLKNHIKIFRITGGEPLINANTFRFLDFLIENPMPELKLGINSNLGIPKSFLDKFISKIQIILKKKHIKEFFLFTSIDTFGKNAEFIRYGLNYDDYMGNLKKFLDEVPETEVNLMCTYNALSVINFNLLLKDTTELKKKYRLKNGSNRVHLDIPYLKDPSFLSCYVLTPDYLNYMDRDLEYLRQNSVSDETGYYLYSQHEVTKFTRIYQWFKELEESNHRTSTRRAFFVFICDYQRRKQIKFQDYCPEYSDFFEQCKSIHLK